MNSTTGFHAHANQGFPDSRKITKHLGLSQAECDPDVWKSIIENLHTLHDDLIIQHQDPEVDEVAEMLGGSDLSDVVMSDADTPTQAKDEEAVRVEEQRQISEMLDAEDLFADEHDDWMDGEWFDQDEDVEMSEAEALDQDEDVDMTDAPPLDKDAMDLD